MEKNLYFFLSSRIKTQGKRLKPVYSENFRIDPLVLLHFGFSSPTQRNRKRQTGVGKGRTKKSETSTNMWVQHDSFIHGYEERWGAGVEYHFQEI